MKTLAGLILGVLTGLAVHGSFPNLIKNWLPDSPRGGNIESTVGVQSNGFLELEKTRDYYYSQRLNFARYLAIKTILYWKERNRNPNNTTNEVERYMHPHDFDLLLAACPSYSHICRELVEPASKYVMSTKINKNDELVRRIYFTDGYISGLAYKENLEDELSILFSAPVEKGLKAMSFIKHATVLKSHPSPEDYIVSRLRAGDYNVLKVDEISEYIQDQQRINKAIDDGWRTKSSKVTHFVPESALKVGFRPALDLTMWILTDDVQEPTMLHYEKEKAKPLAREMLAKYVPEIPAGTDPVKWYNHNYKNIYWSEKQQVFSTKNNNF